TLKATNAILVMSAESCEKPEPKACIHCGRCVAACPIGLNPTIFAKAMEVDDEAARFQMLSKAKGYLCITCGSCSYVCPSARPLTEINAKASAFAYKYNAMLEAKKREEEKE
ncbi:MAG: 4Fe-4S dicluster domain-containing protein, partial [Oscillospiraceae bacterium]|nr:4Fe-4S dicluster domain-containing protein [Oscillospiraceae bacterium]